MKILTKWLHRNKKRHYKIVYVATGFMGNKYDAGIFEFNVSDKMLKIMKMTPESFGFNQNFDALSKHFPIVNNVYSIRSARITA